MTTDPFSLYVDTDINCYRGGFAAVLESLSYENSFHHYELYLPTHAAARFSRRQFSFNFLSLRFSSSYVILKSLLLVLDVILSLRFFVFRKYCKNKCPDKFVCWIGSDWSGILRGLIVAKIINPKTIILHVFDDIYLNLEDSLTKDVLNFFVKKLVVLFDCHFAVSSSLAQKFGAEHGIECRQAFLPFGIQGMSKALMYAVKSTHTKIVQTDSTSYNLLFVGGVNQFLENQLINVDCLLNKGRASSVSVKLFVVSASVQALQLLRSAENLVLCPNLSDAEIKLRFSSSNTILLLPFSPDFSAEKLVLYSFPSKLLKYFVYDFPIIYLGPDHADFLYTHAKWVHTCANLSSLVDAAFLRSILDKHASFLTSVLPSLHSFDTYVNQMSAAR